ncbi:unnamed protein product [Didymodactylos carnosus]|uniref:G-protein coupled receptors family 1 profile domain-containing protein n=1 Tax=Didymodactylos carnosus TaxID=1234261 RepID=A0A814HMB1_9BILA|nr:unnamed protein product [Didymodactylos carnosus]CAF1045416.1 unnamed protein product [Didymodactylos carnosus]CAF3783448.1 unnamed protein product [Didymodactylos carnosus]CAF3813417.1 unnamed protein product [Didymodactylos carnosus]
MFYLILICVNWIYGFLNVIPYYYAEWFEYLGEEEYMCYINFTNDKRLAIAATIQYGIPLGALAVIYIWIWHYVRKRTLIMTLTAKRRMQIKRNIEMLGRIIIPVCILLVLAVPGFCFIIMAAIKNNGTVYYLTYRLTFSFVGLSMIIMPIAVILLTPNIKTALIFNKNRKSVAFTNAGAGGLRLRRQPRYPVLHQKATTAVDEARQCIVSRL